MGGKERPMSEAYIQDANDIKLMVNSNGQYIYPEKPNVFEMYIVHKI